MGMENTMIKNISFQHFEGTATPLQKSMLEKWLQDADNTELYYEWLNEWENLHPQFIPDADSAYSRIIQKKIAVDPVSIILKKRTVFGWLFQIKSIAAITILCILSIGFLSSKEMLFNKKVQTAFGEIRAIVLPDGTVVTMNANSAISYPRFGFLKKRAVSLTGEADFSVTHLQSDQPFIVKTSNSLDVVVLGTQFTVYARQGESGVVLKKGKVQLNYASANQVKKLLMKPGDLFTVNAVGVNELRNIPNPEYLSAWKNHDYFFEKTSLREIAKVIKNNYGVDMKFENDSLAEKKITGTFHADTIVELFDVITEILGINYNSGDKMFYFYD